MSKKLSKWVIYYRQWANKFNDKGTVDFPGELYHIIAALIERFNFAYLKELFISSLLTLSHSRTADVSNTDVSYTNFNNTDVNGADTHNVDADNTTAHSADAVNANADNATYANGSGKIRKWTKGEMMAYIDWSEAEDQRIEADVAQEIEHNPQERRRRGVGDIWKQAEKDIEQQQTLHG